MQASHSTEITMRQQEVRRRILDLLRQAVDTDESIMEDTNIADQLQIPLRIVQGNLQLLEQAGYILLRDHTYMGVALALTAELTPIGEVLLYEEEEGGGPEALAYARRILSILEQQVAYFGPYAPPYLIAQRDEQRHRVADLETQILPAP
jgi:hypothetical protein